MYTSVVFNSTAVLTCVAKEWEAPLHIVNKVDYFCLFCKEERCRPEKGATLHMVIMKSCALKDWFDYIIGAADRGVGGNRGSLPQAPKIQFISHIPV